MRRKPFFTFFCNILLHKQIAQFTLIRIPDKGKIILNVKRRRKKQSQFFNRRQDVFKFLQSIDRELRGNNRKAGILWQSSSKQIARFESFIIDKLHYVIPRLYPQNTLDTWTSFVYGSSTTWKIMIPQPYRI